MILDCVSTRDSYMNWLGLPKGNKSSPGVLPVIIPFPADAYSLQGDTKLFHQKEGSGLCAHYVPVLPVPWQDTKSFHILGSEFYALNVTQPHLFHQVESFVAQNGKDQVHLCDFVIFCCPTHPDMELMQPVSNIYL
jgi:hypothetical protein